MQWQEPRAQGSPGGKLDEFRGEKGWLPGAHLKLTVSYANYISTEQENYLHEHSGMGTSERSWARSWQGGRRRQSWSGTGRVKHRRERFVCCTEVYKKELRKITLEREVGTKSWAVFVLWPVSCILPRGKPLNIFELTVDKIRAKCKSLGLNPESYLCLSENSDKFKKKKSAVIGLLKNIEEK